MPRLIEAGKVLAKRNADRLKLAHTSLVAAHGAITDMMKDAGADPDKDGDSDKGDTDGGDEEDAQAKEAARALLEAVMRKSDTHDARHTMLSKSLRTKVEQEAADANPMGMGDGPTPYPWIQDVSDDAVVYSQDGSLYQRPYSIDSTGEEEAAIWGDPTEVELAYLPVSEANRDEIPDEDCAGKDKSFPIVVPADVAKAARAMGRAGADNYPTAKIKANIIAIAKRKGGHFVSQLPKAWRAGIDTKESAADVAIEIDFVRLQEAAGSGDALITLITPGMGSSGYYPADMLKRDGPGVFVAGTKMFSNHPTAAEEAARPERKIEDLVATLTSPARWLDQGPDGPGLYADANVVETWRPDIAALKDRIGVSIRADGKASMGEIEGRKVPIIQSIARARSVDFVTDAGRGGRIVSLKEAAAQRHSTTPAREEKPMPLSEAEGKALQESVKTLTDKQTQLEQENARLREANALRDASEFAVQKLAGVALPDVTKARLVESLAKNPPMKDGVLDREAFAAQIAEAAKAEGKYLAEITGGGRIRGMGSASFEESAGGGEMKPEELNKTLSEAFSGLGMSEAGAKIAASGRG